MFIFKLFKIPGTGAPSTTCFLLLSLVDSKVRKVRVCMIFFNILLVLVLFHVYMVGLLLWLPRKC